VTEFNYKFVSDLGIPKIIPPDRNKMSSVSVQFVIPGLKIAADREEYEILSKKCYSDIWEVDLESSENHNTGQHDTLVTIGFYTPLKPNDRDTYESAKTISILIAERYLGLLSFIAGFKLYYVALQTTLKKKNGNLSKILPANSRSSTEKLKMSIPEKLKADQKLSENIFSALFWLRRGLAEQDPLDTFSALMVCMQILARELVKFEVVSKSCKNCGVELDKSQPSISSLVKKLIVNKLGGDPSTFQRVWKARNAIAAHGNKAVTADVFRDLIALKFETAVLCYNGIKMALSIPVDENPKPSQTFFVSDPFMHVG